MIYQIAALVILSVFYGCYFLKMFVQRKKRHSIGSDRTGKSRFCEICRSNYEDRNLAGSGSGSDQYPFEHDLFFGSAQNLRRRRFLR